MRRGLEDEVVAPAEEGSLVPFVAVLAVGMFVLSGLVVDGGRQIAAQQSALEQAREAARAGAGRLSVDALRDGFVTLDPGLAVQSADRYLRLAGLAGDAEVKGNTVVVHVHSHIDTTVLKVVGLGQLPVSATASASNVHGVTRED